MKVLYIGGTGEISYACCEATRDAGHQVFVYNRGRSETAPGVERIVGDVFDDDAYHALADRRFDAVCQFRVFHPDHARRDADVFAGKTGQYVFISSASAYQKPCRDHLITEDTPLENPFWGYSRDKAGCEAVLLDAHAKGRLPVTVVRPSHTHRRQFPGTFIDGDHLAWRLTAGKPVILHGDGQSLWTLTHADDFARAFVGLLGNPRALGEAYHITRDRAHTWDRIVAAIADCLGAAFDPVYVPSQTLVRYQPDWAGPLLGDKSNSVVFDNTRVRDAVGGWSCEITMEAGIARAAEHVRARLADYTPDAEVDALIDRILTDQRRLGAVA